LVSSILENIFKEQEERRGGKSWGQIEGRKRKIAPKTKNKKREKTRKEQKKQKK